MYKPLNCDPQTIKKTSSRVLCYPGETKNTEPSTSQHFCWKKLRKTGHKIYTKSKTCQYLKRNKKQYGKPHPNEAETIPCDILHVDLIGKYQFTPKEEERNFKSYQMEMNRNIK